MAVFLGDILSWAMPTPLWSLLYSTIVLYDMSLLYKNVVIFTVKIIEVHAMYSTATL